MERMIVKWHESLSVDVEIMYVYALQRLFTMAPDGSLAKWSLFAGTGLSSKVCHALASVWLNKYGVAVECDDILYCELSKTKRQFLRVQHKPRWLVADAMELSSDRAKNIATGDDAERADLLPWCYMLDAGIPCTSRTPLSSKSAGNLNCVQDEKEATGLGFKATRAVIEKHWPQVISLECVTQLGQKGSGADKPSDAEFICESLRSMGYWSHKDILQAQHWGAPNPRERLYWAAILNPEGRHDEVTAFFNTILTGLKPRSVEDISNFITLDDAAREGQADKLRLRTHKSMGPRVSKSMKTAVEWKTEHKHLYDAIGLPWPPQPDHVDDIVEKGGLLPREVEAAWLVHKMFPMAEGVDIEYLDINATAQRIVLGYLDEDGAPKPGRSPWRAAPPTLTGSLRLILRYVGTTGRVRIRTVDAFEAMRLIGWEDEFWNVGDMPPAADLTAETLELYENMAGNAYSAWHYGPWMCALLATAGRFGKQEGLEEDAAADSERSPQASDAGTLSVPSTPPSETT